MKALINFKICDNARECGGIAVCPTKAMYFDEEQNAIVVDGDKCTNCGLCEKECPIGAIMVAKNNEQYVQYIKDIENDPRIIKELFVDRYGAVSLSEFFLINATELSSKIQSDNLTFIEFFDSEIAECLLKSIPIKELTKHIKGEVNYYKIDKDDSLVEQYNIEEYPSLYIFKKNTLLGKITGYYSIEQRSDIEDQINNIINS